MENVYKVRFLKANLLLAATMLAFWSFDAAWPAAITLWLGAIWLFIIAATLAFTLRRSGHHRWQLLTSALLLGLIASAPERHDLLIWVWAAFFMLPQRRRIRAINVLGALLSWLLVASTTSMAQAWMLLLTLGTLSLLAYTQSRRLIDVNGAARQRLRLIPGLNLWAGEQLLRDVNREQTRARRENIHAEVMILHVKRQQLWPCAQKLCTLIHDFESVYRLNRSTLAVLLLSCSEKASAQRRLGIRHALFSDITCRHVPLGELVPDAITLASLAETPGSPGGRS